MGPSIRRRLLVLLLGAVTLLWGATALWSYYDAHHQIDELFDAELAQTGRVLLARAERYLEHPEDGPRDHDRESEHDSNDDEDHDREDHERVRLEPLAHPYEQSLYFQVWSADGQLLYRSSSRMPLQPLASARAGFSDNTVDGRSWRVFALWDRERRFQVQVGQHDEMRRALAASIASHVLYPLGLSLPVLGLLIWIAVGRGLAPLAGVASEVGRRAPQHLLPIDVRHTPLEARPLVEALNTLLERLEQALAGERRFTADAAHELRTPLAGLRTQAQVAMRATDDGERQHALEQLIGGVDRTTHLMAQLLTLARLDPEARLGHGVALDLHELAAGVLSDLAPAAIARNVELSLSANGPTTISGQIDLLRVLVRNLVDNAIRYTPVGGTVRVSVGSGGGQGNTSSPTEQVWLEVLDDGPGIPPAERARVFDRFYRMPGATTGGSGLGLAIVKRIAELHGATLTLDEGEEGRGVRVTVAFNAGAWPSSRLSPGRSPA